MSTQSAIVARRDGLSLGWQVAIVIAMGIASTTLSASAVYFGLRSAVQEERSRNDQQDVEISRRAEKSDVDALRKADDELIKRIERERADWKEFALEVRTELREIRSYLKVIAERGKP